jgi:protein SCO1/2
MMKKPRPGALLAAVAGAWLLAAGAPPQATAHGGHHELMRKAAPAKGGDFTLQSANGPVSLVSLRGKVVAIYFSYMSCADICPTYLAAVAQAMRLLTPAEAAQVQPMFVTLDPDRDGAQALAEYASAFHPSMLGLTGSPGEIAAAANAYGVLHRRVAGKAGGYDIDHSSMLHVIGRNGNLRERLPHDASARRIAAALRLALGTTR